LLFKEKNPGDVVEKDLKKWYQSLFSPSVKAGIIRPEDLLGYRKGQVYIRGSRHVPLPKEALMDAMDALFECLKKEEHAAVRAVLGHFIFVYIHPYMDGNGRTGRFLMNTMFASGGYPWTIIRVKNRKEYLSALEKASSEANIEPFARFVAKEQEG
jgi:Fic family protein